MAWTDNFLAAGYVFNAADMRIVQGAIYQRIEAWNYSAGRQNWQWEQDDPIAGDPPTPPAYFYYPHGINPPTTEHPANLQFVDWYVDMQTALADMFIAGQQFVLGIPPDVAQRPGVVKLGVNPDGTAILTPTFYPNGMHGLEQILYTSIGNARADAGLTDYSTQTDYSDWEYSAFRRRKPREISSFSFTGNFNLDIDGNNCIAGARAWLVAKPGVLVQWDGAKWNQIVQAEGIGPDVMDSHSARPNYVQPDFHRAGDYIGPWLLHELKAFCKIVTRFARTTSFGPPTVPDAAATVGKFGFGINKDISGNWENIIWNDVRDRAIADFVASAGTPGGYPGGGYQVSFSADAGAAMTPGGVPVRQWSMTLASHRARISNELIRTLRLTSIEMYAGAMQSQFGGAFDAQGTNLVYGQWKKQAAAGYTITHVSASEDRFTSDLIASIAIPPDRSIAAPAFGTTTILGYTIFTLFWVATYTFDLT